MKHIITSSALITVILFAGCGRSPQEGSKADGAGTNQLTRTEVGVGAGESENWGYLGLKIVKLHEHQKALDKAPWHEPGGDWTFLECAAEKDAAVQVVVGSRARGSTKGDIPISWGEAFLAVSNPSAGAGFVEAFSKAFHQPLPPRHGEKPPGFLKMGTAMLGANLVRDPKGGYTTGRKGTWTTTKWFLQSETAEAEVFFNYSVAAGRAEFCEKDEEYREELVEQLVVGLRDGPLPERTPENDPTLTLVGPRVVGWTQIAGTNESAQFTPRGDNLLITATSSGEGAKLFLAPTTRPQERKPLADFEGSVLVDDFRYGEKGLALFVAETIRRDPKTFSTTDPQRLWLVDSQGKHPVIVPAGITNWVAGKGGISPDGRFVALHAWRKQAKQKNLRVVHLGDLQKGNWQTVELADTVLELVGWKGEKPKGVVLTGNSYDKSGVRKAYSLEPETGRLSPEEAVPARLNSKVMSSPAGRHTAEVQEKQGVVIGDLAGGQSRVFTFHPSDRRSLYPDSVRWASDRYLVFQGPRTALIDVDALKMSFPVARESGITSVEFNSDFKWGLGTKKDGQYLGVVELPENRKAAE